MPRVLVDTIIVNVKAAQTSLHNHKMYSVTIMSHVWLLGPACACATPPEIGWQLLDSQQKWTKQMRSWAGEQTRSLMPSSLGRGWSRGHRAVCDTLTPPGPLTPIHGSGHAPQPSRCSSHSMDHPGFLISRLLQRWRFCLALIVKTFQWHFTAQHWEAEQKPLRLCLVVNLSEILAI